jgi:hypothetical protein
MVTFKAWRAWLLRACFRIPRSTRREARTSVCVLTSRIGTRRVSVAVASDNRNRCGSVDGFRVRSGFGGASLGRRSASIESGRRGSGQLGLRRKRGPIAKKAVTSFRSSRSNGAGLSGFARGASHGAHEISVE